MNPLLEQRRTIAKRIVRQLGELPNVVAVLVFGSVASGYVDADSDIDMLVVCEPEIPPMTVRRSCLSGVGERWTIGTDKVDALFPVVDEAVTAEGIAVTLHYQRETWIGDVLEEVVTQGAITSEKMPFRPYTLAGLLERALVLEDKQGTVAAWRTRTEGFSPVLKQHLLDHFIPQLQEHTDELVSNARRHIGPVVFIFNLNWAVDALVGMLYALNDIYDPADRRAERTIWTTFQVAPKDFSGRLSEILSGPFDDETAIKKAEQFEMLAKEILALIR